MLLSVLFFWKIPSFLALGIRPGALHVGGNYFTTDLHPSPNICIFWLSCSTDIMMKLTRLPCALLTLKIILFLTNSVWEASIFRYLTLIMNYRSIPFLMEKRKKMKQYIYRVGIWHGVQCEEWCTVTMGYVAKLEDIVHLKCDCYDLKLKTPVRAQLCFSGSHTALPSSPGYLSFSNAILLKQKYNQRVKLSGISCSKLGR